jgi:hypothetical protein
MLRARALGSFAVVTGCIAMTGGGVTGIRSVSRAG